MKEIKIRAWDKNRKKMGWVEYLIFDYKNNIEDDEWVCYTTDNMEIKERPTGDYREKQNVILMQCTGLKDKNNKEIYYGDIIKYRDVREHISSIDYIEELGTGAYFRRIDIGYNSLNPKAINAYDIEIIGNVYENPELISE